MAAAIAQTGGTRGASASLGRQLANRLPGLVSLAVFLGGWQLLILLFDSNPMVFPAPAAVASGMIEAIADGSAVAALMASVWPLTIGMLLATTAIPLGLTIGLSPATDLITSPYLWGFFALPNIAFAPLLILWFGFGTTTRIWMVFLSAAVPLCLSCKDGVQTVDASLVRVARSFSGGRIAVFTKVISPCAMPFIASGVRNAISRGFVGLLSVEMLVGSAGIGGEVIRSMRTYDTARMFAFVVLLIVIALVLVSGSRHLEVWASRWRDEVVL